MKRRKFLQYSATGLTGAIYGTPVVSALLSSCSNSNRKISVALVGCTDESVDILSDVLSGNEGISLKQVFDFETKKSENAIQSFTQSLGYSPELAKDFQTILNNKETNAVILFIPEKQALKLALQTIKAGKDLFIANKPNFNVSEMKQLSDLSHENNQIVQCGYSMRSNSFAVTAKAYIDDGNLGQVLHVKVFYLNKENEESDYTETLDLARFLMGDPAHPGSVYGYQSGLSQRQVVTWDFKDFTVKSEIGLAYDYLLSGPVSLNEEPKILPWLLQSKRIEVYGSKGLLHLDPAGGSWQVQGNKGEVLASHNGTKEPALPVKDFLDCVRTGELPVANVSQVYLSKYMAQMGNVACLVGNKHLIFDTEKELFPDNEQANKLMKS